MKQLDFKGKKVLITGGAGFIGSNITEKIAHFGGEPIVLDDLFTGAIENIDLNVKYEFINGSVNNKRLVFELIQRMDYIIHLAARNIIVSTKNPMEDYKTNIGGTLNILMAAKKYGIERMVYSSSASVYGNPGAIPIKETESVYTFSPYAVSKLAGENYCHAFYETYDLPTVSLRYSNVYGPKQNPKNPYSGVISKFIKLINNGKCPEIHGDGLQTRDFTYIDDVVDATLVALLSDKAEGMVFNIGTSIESSILGLLKKLSTIYNKDISPIHIDRRDIDNIRRRALNIEQIRTRLRWQPQINLFEGLKRTVEWYNSYFQSSNVETTI